MDPLSKFENSCLLYIFQMVIIALLLFVISLGLYLLLNVRDDFSDIVCASSGSCKDLDKHNLAGYRMEPGACRRNGDPRQGRYKRQGYRTIEECRRRCNRDRRCTSFDYGRPRGDKYDCYLHYNKPIKGVRMPGCQLKDDCHCQIRLNTDLRLARNSKHELENYLHERGACRENGDIKKGKWTRQGYLTVNRCKQRCDRDRNCQAISYGRPRGNRYDCYLMHNFNNKGIEMRGCHKHNDCHCQIKILPTGRRIQRHLLRRPRRRPLRRVRRVKRVRPPSGIKVLQASYGPNCGVKAGNVTQQLAKACDGRRDCSYRVDHRVIGDPAYGCRKVYKAAYLCDGKLREVSAAPEASGKTVHLSCKKTKPGIKVIKASYGPNCGVKEGNVTQQLAKACDGRRDCTYRIDHRLIGDPAYGCRKVYNATYLCDGKRRGVSAPPEASGKTIKLKC